MATHLSVLTLAMPVYNADGSVRGVVGMDIGVGSIRQALDSYGKDSRHTLALFNDDQQTLVYLQLQDQADNPLRLHF